MRLILLLVLSFSMILPQQSMAGMFESKWLEPLIFGTIAATVAMSTAPKGSETQMGSIGFAAGALVGYSINSYYDSKYASRYKQEADQLKRELDDFKNRDAQSAANGLKTRYGIIRHERVESQKLDNGSVTSPYFIEYHSIPGATDDYIGE